MELKRPPRRFGPGRRAFFASLQGLARAAGGRAFYRRWFLGPGRLRVRRERVSLPAAQSAFEGYRIVHWSDLHAGPFLGRGDLRNAVELSNGLEPDLVAITGDFLTDEPDEALALIDDLAGLRARDGVFAVLGNHDYRRRAERGWTAEYERRAGIRFLLDQNTRIRRGEQVLAVIGLEDLEEARQVSLEQARRGLDPTDLQVVLCHNPGAAEQLAGDGVALVLSGHSHGHQIDLPGIRRLAPRHPGDRRDLGPTVAITSRGLGALGLPLRVRSPAELVAIDLVCAGGRGDAR